MVDSKKAAETVDSCPLCLGNGPLRRSHVISKFAFDWLKETSATGYMRHGPQPNVRVQDGFKEELLCDSCEQLLSSWESPAAEQLFKPYHADSSTVVNYGPWLGPDPSRSTEATLSASVGLLLILGFRSVASTWWSE